MYIQLCCVCIKNKWTIKNISGFLVGCEMEKADLIFIVDTSGSIQFQSDDGFQLIIQFIKDTVQLFPIGLQDSLVGVILFSNDATLHFNVQTHIEITTLLTALDSLPYDGGNTNQAAALELLLSSAQDGTMGLRPGYPHIAILITDGISTVNPEQTVPIAQQIHASNIFQSLLAVGITNEVDHNELVAIATDSSCVFYSTTFDGLSQLTEDLSYKICDGELTYVITLHLSLLHTMVCLLLVLSRKLIAPHITTRVVRHETSMMFP